ncbi:MAG: CdaR family protein [Erysipelotrichaceae bacterium]|nr:CdaR family protein [Erysipelotrichaceae bacterium]
MKKNNALRNIIKFIDRKIIFPITKLILAISERFSKSSKVIENWLSKSNTLLFISLIFAVALFIAVDQRKISMRESSAEVLKDVPVIAEYNQESYVIEGLPDKVDVTLIGGKSDLYFAKQSGTQNIVVDLSDLKPGTHKVSINYTQDFRALEYSVNPSTATIIIYQKESATKNVTYDLINQNKLGEKKIVDNVTISASEVIVKGPEYKLNQVAIVKALINLEKLPTQEVGTQTIDNVPLVAYDENGEIVDVEIVPETLSAEVVIKSPSKEVPIKIVPKGTVAFGYAIKSIVASDSKITVWGSSEALADLKYIEVSVNVSDIKSDQQYKLEIAKPAGVRYMSISTITVNVTLDATSDRELSNVGLKYKNLNEDKYKVQASSSEDTNVTIILKGVSSVIEQIKETDVTAYIDLSGYTEGEYEVEVKVEGNDSRVEYVAKTKKVKIKILKIK